MAARAIWKGVIQLGKESIPIKLYSAVQDKSIHFRLLHEKDLVPVKQKLVDSGSGDEVDRAEVKKAYPLKRDRLVVLEEEELQELEPEESRDIEITRFVDPADIDHRWYDRAYFLGPDGSSAAYFAFAEALEKKGVEGVARWVMRKKEYVGALRARDGYLMLIVLRHADEVILADELPRPGGRALDKREVSMAKQLVEALSGSFDPEEFQDTYRQRVLELVATKAAGKKVTVKKFRRPAAADDSLDKALRASLAGVEKRRAAGGRR